MAVRWSCPAVGPAGVPLLLGALDDEDTIVQIRDTTLEAKRRIEDVVNRIENSLLKAEEKRWEDLDAPRRGIKDRLGKILARTPDLRDQQVASAIYLLSVGRVPTDDEVARAKTQFAENVFRPATVLALARALVQGKEFNANVAGANGRVLKLQKDPASAEVQKMTSEIAASLDKAVKSDEQLIDLAFLLVLSRFPTSTQSETARAHLKKGTNRPAATENIFWALMNTKEFALAP
jgi:hypothetical protein